MNLEKAIREVRSALEDSRMLSHTVVKQAMEVIEQKVLSLDKLVFLARKFGYSGDHACIVEFIQSIFEDFGETPPTEEDFEPFRSLSTKDTVERDIASKRSDWIWF